MTGHWTALAAGIVIAIAASVSIWRWGRKASPATSSVAPSNPQSASTSSAASSGQVSLARGAAPSGPECSAATPPPLAAAQVFARLHDLALGPPRSIVSGKQEAMREKIIAGLHDAATQQRYAPRRPNMLPRLIGAAGDEDVSRRELASIIAQDPALVGSLLSIANSSYYRVTAEPVESVDRALVLLGTNGLRSLISAALLQPIFRTGGGTFRRFPEIAWEHAFRSANAAVPHAVIVEKTDPFAAELLSLLTGLGGIVVFRVALDLYGTDPHLSPDADVIAALLETQSLSVARRIGGSWELSERTLSALDVEPTSASAPLGRSLHFGRIVGALAVLRLNGSIDEPTAIQSIPPSSMSAADLGRMWSRLTLRARTNRESPQR